WPIGDRAARRGRDIDSNLGRLRGRGRPRPAPPPPTQHPPRPPHARRRTPPHTDALPKQPPPPPVPTESDLAFARTAASDVLTKGDKDSSQPWENPETGARGSVTPLSQAYSAEDRRTCRDFLASYVNGRVESWLQGAACKAGQGRWEIHTIKPWTRGWD